MYGFFFFRKLSVIHILRAEDLNASEFLDSPFFQGRQQQLGLFCPAGRVAVGISPCKLGTRGGPGRGSCWKCAETGKGTETDLGVLHHGTETTQEAISIEPRKASTPHKHC